MRFGTLKIIHMGLKTLAKKNDKQKKKTTLLLNFTWYQVKPCGDFSSGRQ